MPNINKINKLFKSEGFLQINFVKGFKYVDRAGEIVNYFHKDNKIPIFTMNLNGLDIFEPEEKVERIKISPKSFWAHFIEPDSLEQMEEFVVNKSKDVLNILDVETIDRIGWRIFFVYEFNTEEARQDVLKKFTISESLSLEETTFNAEINSVKLIIRLRKITKKDDSELPCLLIDIDFYQRYESPFLTPNETVSKFNDFKVLIRSEELLSLINNILE